MQDDVQNFVEQGLVTKQGRYRYVTPHILGVWLAADVWDARGEAVIELMRRLPGAPSRKEMLRRIAELGDHEQARRVVDRLLSDAGLFPDLRSINDPTRAEILGILTDASPVASLRALQRILGGLDCESLLRLDRGRRHVVWTLELLKRHPETFFGAARLLLALAEAENEPYANNATGVWRNSFLTYLGGTPVPALERHDLIREALASPLVGRRILAVKGLDAALKTHEVGSGRGRMTGRLPPSEWHPRTIAEDREVRESALHLLDQALNDPDSRVSHEAKKVLLGASRSIVSLGFGSRLLSILEQHEPRNDEDRRALCYTIQAILRYEKASLSPELREQYSRLLEKTWGDAFRDRIRRWIGELTLTDRMRDKDGLRSADKEAEALADEAMSNPDLLRSELDWLCSGKAQNIWFFGRRLGQLDHSKSWLDELIEQARKKRGLVFLGAYLMGRSDSGESKWREEILDVWADNEETLSDAVSYATRCGPANTRAARRLIRMVERGWLMPDRLSALVYGAWPRDLPVKDFKDVLCCMMQDEKAQSTEAALAMLHNRLQTHAEDRLVLSDLAWSLLSRPSTTTRSVMIDYHWTEVAKYYADEKPIRVVKTILSSIEVGYGIPLQDDERGKLLLEATKRAPIEAWNLIGDSLLRRDKTSISLGFELRGWFVDKLETNRLLVWASEHEPTGPQILAELAAVDNVPLNPLARELLTKYGDSEGIGSALSASYLTGTFSGPLSHWLEAKLTQARAWVKDPEPRIRRWAEELVSGLEQRLERARLREEEM